ncbi:MAG: Pyrophosphatase PpaX [Chloroflexi bacterium]|nr:Pyrophosphatase PpaX [Chloroflexota bacterium]
MLLDNSTTTILFDLDGTLLFHTPSSLDVFLQILAEKGFEHTQTIETWRQLRRWIHYYWGTSPELAGDIRIFGKSGELTEAFWANYLRKKLLMAGVPEAEADELLPQITPLMDARYQPQGRVPGEVPPTLDTLTKEGFTLGLVSNRSDPFQEEIEELGLAEFFDFAITAGEVGSWKPDKQIFHHALGLAGSSAKETIYVGDNYYADILGAQGVGIRPILVDPKGVFPDVECMMIDSVERLLDA